MMPVMQRGYWSRPPRRPTFTRLELALVALGLACVAGQAIVYRGPHPSTAVRVEVVLLGVAAFACFISMAVLAIRRGPAPRRRPGAIWRPGARPGHDDTERR
jgi:hypothetical protein